MFSWTRIVQFWHTAKNFFSKNPESFSSNSESIYKIIFCFFPDKKVQFWHTAEIFLPKIRKVSVQKLKKFLEKIKNFLTFLEKTCSKTSNPFVQWIFENLSWNLLPKVGWILPHVWKTNLITISQNLSFSARKRFET